MTSPWRTTAFAVLSVALPCSAVVAQQKRVITFEDFSSLRVVSDPQVSPDGRTVLYAVRTTDVAANKRTTHTFSIAASGGQPRAFPDEKTAAVEARWSPDGSKVVYTSGGQLWIADASGTGAKSLAKLAGGASGPVWSGAGDRIAFVSSAFPDCRDDACNSARQKAADEGKVKAHVTDALMFRHWNAYDDGTRSHLFVVKSDGSDLRDVVPGARYDVPPGPFGGSEGYAFSPDGREIAFTAKDQGRADAWTTDLNIYVVNAESAGQKAEVITASNKGADQNPIYSTDGKLILYASQKRAGFEADKWRLMAYDPALRRSRELLPQWDRWAESYVAAGARTIIVGGADHGRDKIFRVTFDASGKPLAPTLLAGEHNNSAFSVSLDGHAIVWVRDAVDHPAEVWIAALGPRALENAHALTHENDVLTAQLTLNPAEDFWFHGANGDSVQGFVVKPPQYQPGRKYPVLLLVHGGPQGAWLDSWGSRWAPQLFAAGGYALVFVNPRGSTGYGQKFVDGVSKDWGGKPYVDLMKGLDAALAANPWMDSTRMAAAGGSYGGYMVNWINGHTNRFKAIVSHAGVFNLEAMSGATEEQWFTDWEFGGSWLDPAAMAGQYRKFSPHLFAKNFRTPTLVITGELDYRVPYTDPLSLFTSLQRQGVASRLVVYPDEGHWILKPQNSQLWWKEVHSWLGSHLNVNTRM